MPSLSLKAALAQIGVNGPNYPRIHGGFHSSPSSLKDILKAMQSPQVGQWQKTSESEHANHDWTEECQGVTHDGQHWYISSNKDPIIGSAKRRIYKFTPGMQQVDYFGVDFIGSDHLGGIDHYKGRIYAALEQPAKVMWVTTDFQSSGTDTLKSSSGGSSPQGSSFPWCAVNPWNGLLYSSKFGSADGAPIKEIFAYDPADGFKHKKTLELKSGLKRIQGGVFSNNGHLLLASDHTFDIRCYSALNGAFRGSAAIQIDPGSGEEVEGLTIWKGISFDGTPAEVHVILLDNDFPSGDDIYFKHYSVPDPDKL
ncbi:MAG: hypothetical protein KZQ84_14205 [Candidatus Thiodiazotropha sp. (ex Lucinoma borealis)]|nr:hypothetical protein [Candidatus Thiodiazotropha sp. (ex Lucinoma borealis)]